MSIRHERCKKANQIIQAISEHGRRFFYSERNNQVAKLTVDERGLIYFYDEYYTNGERCYTHTKGRWKNFTGGGTMKRLIEALREYIRTGEPINSMHFGPWDFSWGRDLWGYGDEEMVKVREKVMLTGIVAQSENGEI